MPPSVAPSAPSAECERYLPVELNIPHAHRDLLRAVRWSLRQATLRITKQPPAHSRGILMLPEVAADAILAEIEADLRTRGIAFEREGNVIIITGEMKSDDARRDIGYIN